MADTKAFYKLLFQLRGIENLHDLKLWYVQLSKPSPFGQKAVWDKMSEKDMKLLIKNINEKQGRLEKEEKSKKSVLSNKDLEYLASSNIASGEKGKEILRQIKAIDKWALAAWAAKNFVVSDAGVDMKGNPYDAYLKFKVNGPKLKRGTVIIYLTPNDDYTVVFGQVRGADWKELKRVDMIYFDQLVEVIDQYVG